MTFPEAERELRAHIESYPPYKAIDSIVETASRLFRAACDGEMAAYRERDQQLRDRLDNVCGALVDAVTVTIHMPDLSKSVRELTAQRDNAQSELAAVKAERERHRLMPSPQHSYGTGGGCQCGYCLERKIAELKVAVAAEQRKSTELIGKAFLDGKEEERQRVAEVLRASTDNVGLIRLIESRVEG